MTDLKKVYFIRLSQVSSTNSWMKEHAASLSSDHITCLIAEQQTAGRGRFGKPWVSPKGNIYASLFFCIPKGSSYLVNAGQILVLCACKTLENKGFLPKLKWPNDLYLSGKKVAGVLTETVDLKDRLGVVIGIGLNVNMTSDFLQTVDQPATSLAIESGKDWDIDLLIDAIAEEFRHALFLLETKGFAPFQGDYNERLAFKGEKVQCLQGNKPVEGICHSISSNGSLNLLLPSGDLIPFLAGELKSLRKTD